MLTSALPADHVTQRRRDIVMNGAINLDAAERAC